MNTRLQIARDLATEVLAKLDAAEADRLLIDREYAGFCGSLSYALRHLLDALNEGGEQ